MSVLTQGRIANGRSLDVIKRKKDLEQTHSRHGVKGDRLEADQIVARGNGCRDGSGPGAVLCDHLPGSPRAVVDRSREETSLVNLKL